MRIAFLVGTFPALSETFILNQITGLMDAGHTVDIFAFNRSNDSKTHPDIEKYGLMDCTYYIDVPENRGLRTLAAGWNFLRLFSAHRQPLLRALDAKRYGREAASLSLLLLLPHFLDRPPYDILNCHFGKQGLRGLRLKQLGVQGKLVVTFHGYDVSQGLDKQGAKSYDDLFRTADLLLPVSDFWRRKLVALGADPARVRVHHMGIDVDRFHFQPRSVEPGQPVWLFTVGRLVEKKGIEYSIRALARLLEQHPEANLRYRIMGDGPLCAELRQLISQLGLEGVVELMGSGTQQDVRKYMQQSHLFLLPSVTGQDGDQEGIPVSMMEAMASGMPVISSFHSGIPELVVDGVSGYLVAERDVERLAERLAQVALRPESWLELGQAGRAIVEREFNIQHLNHALEEMYQSLLDGEQPA